MKSSLLALLLASLSGCSTKKEVKKKETVVKKVTPATAKSVDTEKTSSNTSKNTSKNSKKPISIEKDSKQVTPPTPTPTQTATPTATSANNTGSKPLTPALSKSAKSANKSKEMLTLDRTQESEKKPVMRSREAQKTMRDVVDVVDVETSAKDIAGEKSANKEDVDDYLNNLGGAGN